MKTPGKVVGKANSYKLDYKNLYLGSILKSSIQIEDQLKLQKRMVKEVENDFELSDVFQLPTEVEK